MSRPRPLRRQRSRVPSPTLSERSEHRSLSTDPLPSDYPELLDTPESPSLIKDAVKKLYDVEAAKINTLIRYVSTIAGIADVY
jgi:hypothetical protein